MQQQTESRFRRFIVRKGNDNIIFRPEDIAYFFVESKVCFLVDRHTGTKHIISKSLRDLSGMLDPADFYRINKKCIAHIDAIQKFGLCTGGKVELTLAPATKCNMYISQQRINHFKQWIAHARTVHEPGFLQKKIVGIRLAVK